MTPAQPHPVESPASPPAAQAIEGEASGLSVDWLSDSVAIDAMAADWDALAGATDPGSIFLRSGWFAAVWKWSSARSSLAVLRVSRGGRLVGLLPMKREVDRARWPWQHSLRSLDIPDTQQFGLLAERGLEPSVARAVVTELRRVSADFDVIQLRKLHDTRANAALLAEMRLMPRATVSVADFCPAVKLDDDWKTYYGSRSRRLKKGNNLLANHLKKGFREVVVKCEPLDSSARGSELLGEVLALSEQSWKHGFDTALNRPKVRQWLDELRRRFGDAGEMVVWSLRLDGRMAAAEIQLERQGYVAALRADVDEHFNQYGVGSYLNWKVAESLVGSGRKLYNMGPGYSAYKERWANVVLDCHGLTIYCDGPVARIGWLREHYVNAARARLAAIWRRWMRQ